MQFYGTMPVSLKQWLPCDTLVQRPIPRAPSGNQLHLSDHAEELLKILSGSTEFQLHRQGPGSTPELLPTALVTGCPLSPASAGATYETSASGDITGLELEIIPGMVMRDDDIFLGSAQLY